MYYCLVNAEICFLYFSVSLIVIVIVAVNTVVVVDVLFLIWRKNESNQARDDGEVSIKETPRTVHYVYVPPH